jgi:hypothetical protein
MVAPTIRICIGIAYFWLFAPYRIGNQSIIKTRANIVLNIKASTTIYCNGNEVAKAVAVTWMPVTSSQTAA